jgi:capsular polysaccharide biosynthesis protein
MNDMNLEQSDEIEIDLQRLANAVLKRIWVVILVSLIGAAVFLGGTLMLITPKYQSSAMFYVNNSNISVGNVSVSMSSGDLSTSRGLVKSYIVILNTRETLVDVIDYAGVDRSVLELSKMIEAEAVDSTEIFKVTVTSTDPYEAQKIADAISYAKELKDRYTVLWMHYDMFGGE